MKTLKTLIILSVFLIPTFCFAQSVSITNDNTPPDGSAMLDVKSTGKGVLFPRLSTSQRVGISSPANGLLVFDTNTKSFWYYSESWIEILNEGDRTPVGTIIAFAGTAVPQGWLLCDGTALNPANYPDLSVSLGTAWGNGSNDSDPLTTFNIPDLRGVFLRGVDGTAGRDLDKDSRSALLPLGNTGNNVGSYQDDATAVNGLTSSHTHTINMNDGGTTPGNLIPTTNAGPAHSKETAAANGITGGDTETRPINVYVNYIIKY